MATLDELKEVSLGDATTLARAMHLVNIYALLLGEVSNSWSRQRFTSTSSTGLIITWGCCCNFVFHLILNGHLLYHWLTLRSRQRSCRLRCVNFFLSLSFLFNLKDNVTNWDDVVVTKVDCGDLARCC